MNPADTSERPRPATRYSAARKTGTSLVISGKGKYPNTDLIDRLVIPHILDADRIVVPDITTGAR